MREVDEIGMVLAFNRQCKRTPLRPNSPRPSPPNPNHVKLVENIERLKLSIDKILPLHGGVVPVADLYAAVGRKSP